MEIQQQDSQADGIDWLIDTFRRYTKIEKLTPAIVHKFINRIIIHEPVLIASLLKTTDCRGLIEKFNCRHAVDTLVKKIDKEYPERNLGTHELPTKEEIEHDVEPEQ